MENIKKSLICREVKAFHLEASIIRDYQPVIGDVAVFRVKRIGKHNAIQGTRGSNKYIFPGDRIMLAFGNRYASEQFEGYIPEGWQPVYHILGKGGCAGLVTSMHQRMSLRGPTEIVLEAFATDSQGKVINTRYLNRERVPFDTYEKKKYKLILSLGTGMDSGKTTTAAYLARGLHQAGKRVAYVKLTGTVFSKDRAFVRDCGADISTDFSRLGYPSTYMLDEQELLDLVASLLAEAEQIAPDFVIAEIADGLLQRETAMLLRHARFRQMVDHVLLSSGDSFGALAGLEELNRLGLQASALCGAFTAAPLLIKEVSSRTGLPILTLDLLSDASVTQWLVPAHSYKQNGLHQPLTIASTTVK